jgi:CRISPR/Cas system-associated protein endoribonuclease Cas2
MAIVKKTKQREIVIDLTGPDGNVFVLMGTAKRFARQLDLDGDKIINEMKSSDYENAVQVFDKYFGSFVTLLR